MGCSISYNIVNREDFVNNKKIYNKEIKNDLKIYQNFSQKYYPYELERTNHLIGSLKLLTA